MVCYFLFFVGDIKITKIYILKSFVCVSHKQQIVNDGTIKVHSEVCSYSQLFKATAA